MYQKRNKELEVLSLFSGDYNARFYLRQISTLLALPLKTTQNVLARLENENVLKASIDGKNKYFRINKDNPQAKLSLLQAEIHRTSIFLSVYPSFKTFLKSLDANVPIIVFGSFSKFKADKDSDVDMLVVSEKEKLPFHLLPYKVHMVNMSERAFMKALDLQETLLKEIEENHVVLNNHSFYVNVMWSCYGK